MTWVARLSVIVVSLVALQASAVPSASAASYGGYYLQIPCCGGQGLYGTRSSITSPVSWTDWNFPSGQCVFARSDAEILDDRLIQAGFIRCHNAQHPNGGCGFTGTLENEVEIKWPGAGYQCWYKGTIGYNTTHLYTVRRSDTDNGWYAFIDGVRDTQLLPMGGAQIVVEGPEYTGSPYDAYQAYADWAYSELWQRWTGSSWYTVQQAWWFANWTNIGGPYGHWQTTHGY